MVCAFATASATSTMQPIARHLPGVLGHLCALFWDARSGTLAVDYVSPVKLGTCRFWCRMAGRKHAEPVADFAVRDPRAPRWMCALLRRSRSVV